jgi:hypothetical protein
MRGSSLRETGASWAEAYAAPPAPQDGSRQRQSGALSPQANRVYIGVKEPTMTAERYLGLAAAAMLMAAGTGVAFAGWLGHGPEIMLSLAQSGLGWCF